MAKIKISTDVHVIKNKQKSTIEFKLIFPVKKDNNNQFFVNILNLFLTSSNHDILDIDVYKREISKKTILNISFNANYIVDNTYLVYSFSLPKEGLIKDYNLEESFAFAIDNLFNPACEDGHFNEIKFAYEKAFIITDFMNSERGIYAANYGKFFEIADPDEEIYNHFATSKAFLSQLDSTKLYDFYRESILNNAFLTYVHGDISEAKARSLFQKYCPQKAKSITIDINYFKPLKMGTQTYQDIITHFNQSALFLEYQVDMLEKELKYLATLINILISSENNLLFEALRVKNNLVYDVHIKSLSSRALFVIVAYIPTDKYRETKQIIKEVFESLEDAEYFNSCHAKLVKGLELDLLKESDEESSLLNKAIDEDLHITTTEKLLKDVQSVKFKDFISFLKKVTLTNEVFFRGDAR